MRTHNAALGCWGFVLVLEEWDVPVFIAANASLVFPSPKLKVWISQTIKQTPFHNTGKSSVQLDFFWSRRVRKFKKERTLSWESGRYCSRANLNPIFEAYLFLGHCKIHFSYWVLLMSFSISRAPSHISQSARASRLFSYHSWMVPLSGWVWKSLCNFVQSDVLDILLYISVNKMWTNCRVSCFPVSLLWRRRWRIKTGWPVTQYFTQIPKWENLVLFIKTIQLCPIFRGRDEGTASVHSLFSLLDLFSDRF